MPKNFEDRAKKRFSQRQREAHLAKQVMKDLAKKTEETVPSMPEAFEDVGVSEHRPGVSTRIVYADYVDMPPVPKKSYDDYKALPDSSDLSAETGLFILVLAEEETKEDENPYAFFMPIRKGRSVIPVGLEDPWVVVEYLIGEDLDPVTIFQWDGIKVSVEAYRRCNKWENPYREKWVPVTKRMKTSIPVELFDQENPRKKQPFNTDDFIGRFFD